MKSLKKNPPDSQGSLGSMNIANSHVTFDNSWTTFSFTYKVRGASSFCIRCNVATHLYWHPSS